MVDLYLSFYFISKLPNDVPTCLIMYNVNIKYIHAYKIVQQNKLQIEIPTNII